MKTNIFISLFPVIRVMPIILLIILTVVVFHLYVRNPNSIKSDRSAMEKRRSELRTTQAKIISIEQEKYYVHMYTPAEESRMDVNYIKHLPKTMANSSYFRAKIKLSEEPDSLIEMKKHRDAVFNKNEKKKSKKFDIK